MSSGKLWRKADQMQRVNRREGGGLGGVGGNHGLAFCPQGISKTLSHFMLLKLG